MAEHHEQAMPTQQPANPLWSALWLQRALRFISAAHKRRQQNRPYQSWLCQSAVVKNSAKHHLLQILSLLLKAQCRLNLAKPVKKNQNQSHAWNPSISICSICTQYKHKIKRWRAIWASKRAKIAKAQRTQFAQHSDLAYKCLATS